MTLTVHTPDGPMAAFLAAPATGEPAPGLVVVQEAYGVNEHIRDVCRRFAREGFVAMAPELYHRADSGLEIDYTDMPRAMALLGALTNEQIETDLKAALGALRADARVDGNRCGVVGFCMGGLAAFLAACRTDAAASVAFYGGGIVRERPKMALRPLLDEADRIRAPLLMLFGADDASIPATDVDAIRARLAAVGAPHEVVVYPGAGHAFFNDRRAPAYRAEAAADAWTRTLAWFRRHLGDRATSA